MFNTQDARNKAALLGKPAVAPGVDASFALPRVPSYVFYRAVAVPFDSFSLSERLRNRWVKAVLQSRKASACATLCHVHVNETL